MRPGRLLDPLLPRPETGGRLPRAAYAVATGLVVAVTVALVVGQQLVGMQASSSPVREEATGGAGAQVQGATGTYSFALVQPDDQGRPVAWDPCRTIPLEVNDRLAPDAGARLLSDAVAVISQASGLRFSVVGRTDRLPEARRTGTPPGRIPALVAWTTPEQLPALRGDVAGVGGSTARPASIRRDLEYVTGIVALDAPQLREVLDQPGGLERTRAIIVHELAHLVGLDHVDDPDELMNADNIGRLDLGPGDREGLAALGDGPCY